MNKSPSKFKVTEVTKVTLNPVSPFDLSPEPSPKDEIDRPSFITHDSLFLLNGNKAKPGLYWHGCSHPKGNENPKPMDKWICTPIHAKAITSDPDGSSFGLLLRFQNTHGAWKEWATPMHLLKGSSEELRGDLLDQGVRIEPANKALLTKWMMDSYPSACITAATTTGWHSDEQSFVLPNRTIGDSNVCFQSNDPPNNDFTPKGTLQSWKESVALPCSGNPMLLFAVSIAFTGPLLLRAKRQISGGSGFHLVGDSSLGKTTALQLAASVWASQKFVKTWHATSNGLEASAALANDTLLILDEISECDPKEIGAIVYSLANGHGKQRARRNGRVKQAAEWRTITLSSGERTLSAHMEEGHCRIKAGQETRLLDIQATNRTHGIFDVIHKHANPRSFSDSLKQDSSSNFGHAGPAFIEKLLTDNEDFVTLFNDARHIKKFATSDAIEGRAANYFALVGLAGEKATQYGITGWHSGEATQAAIISFENWRQLRGEGQTETRQILKSISDFISRHGDSRFSNLIDTSYSNTQVVKDRAGYWRDDLQGRIYLFHPLALKEASAGYDIRRILDALEKEKWLIEHDHDSRGKTKKINGTSKKLYVIREMSKSKS